MSWSRTLATSPVDATTVDVGDQWAASTSLDVAATVVGTTNCQDPTTHGSVEAPCASPPPPSPLTTHILLKFCVKSRSMFQRLKVFPRIAVSAYLIMPSMSTPGWRPTLLGGVNIALPDLGAPPAHLCLKRRSGPFLHSRKCANSLTKSEGTGGRSWHWHLSPPAEDLPNVPLLATKILPRCEAWQLLHLQLPGLWSPLRGLPENVSSLTR